MVTKPKPVVNETPQPTVVEPKEKPIAPATVAPPPAVAKQPVDGDTYNFGHFTDQDWDEKFLKDLDLDFQFLEFEAEDDMRAGRI